MDKLKNIFDKFTEIKLVYLFGSRATSNTSPLSDYDFAVYLDEKISIDKKKDIVLTLISQLSLILKTDRIDMVILNDYLSPLLKYQVIKEGKLIHEKEPYKLIFETNAYNDYFDFKLFQQLHNL